MEFYHHTGLTRQHVSSGDYATFEFTCACVCVAAGVVFGAVQITSANTSNTEESVFVGMTPTRLLDTREGQTTFDGFDQAVGRLDANSTYELNIAGRAGITQGAVAAVINMVAVDPTAPGYLTVWPCSDSKPLASALNYETGETTQTSSASRSVTMATSVSTHTAQLMLLSTSTATTWPAAEPASKGQPARKEPPARKDLQEPASPQKVPLNMSGNLQFNGTETGDVWIDVNNDAWVWTEENDWDNVGNISGPAGDDGADGQDGAQGPEGPQGPVGTGIAAKGSLDYVGPPTDKDDPESGDVWIDSADDAWVWTDEGEWDNVGNISGPPGKDGATRTPKATQGDTGPQGPTRGATGPAGDNGISAGRIYGRTITSLSTIDSTGDVGQYASITIGVDGNPIISYQR